MTSDAINFQMTTNQIGRITLNQPGKRNAMTAAMWDALTQAVVQAEADPDLRILIIRGAGENFTVGNDVTEFATQYATPGSAKLMTQRISAALNAIAMFSKPTIAKIRGACMGDGCGIALACDMRISDGTALYSIAPGKLGRVYPFDAMKRLIQAVGVAYAKDMLFSGRVIKADEAKSIGLINGLYDQYELEQEVREYALSVCEMSGYSAKVTNQMFMAYEAGQRGETSSTKQWVLDGYAAEDFKKGYIAFLEKRRPDFR